MWEDLMLICTQNHLAVENFMLMLERELCTDYFVSAFPLRFITLNGIGLNRKVRAVSLDASKPHLVDTTGARDSSQ